MKSLLLLVVLAVFSASYDAAVLRDEDSTAVDFPARSNLSLGTIGTSDKLLRRDYFRKGAIANTVQWADITYRGNIRINAIRVRDQWASQGATPSIRAGGVGRNFVTIRLTSRRGRGYHFMIEIWGR